MAMKKIEWLESYLDIFEKNAQKVILSPKRIKTTKIFWSDKNKKLSAKAVLKLTASLRKIVSENKTLEEAIMTTMVLMSTLYEMRWLMTYPQMEEIERGRKIGSKIKRKQWVLAVRDIIPERCNRAAEKLRYLRSHQKDNPLKLPVGNIYVEGDKNGNDKLIYNRPGGKKESITIETFRTEYLTKKLGK
jgi:ribosomal protein L16 Arg81 hydroxylase